MDKRGGEGKCREGEDCRLPGKLVPTSSLNTMAALKIVFFVKSYFMLKLT